MTRRRRILREPDRPDVVRGAAGDRDELVLRQAGVGARRDLPRVAVEVLDQRALGKLRPFGLVFHPTAQTFVAVIASMPRNRLLIVSDEFVVVTFGLLWSFQVPGTGDVLNPFPVFAAQLFCDVQLMTL